MKSGYIAILGAPNSGKSTLLNALLKDKVAAVSDKPQTTRRKFIGIHTSKKAQMIFLDTPGIHHSEKPLNQFMAHEVQAAVQDANILCYLIGVDQLMEPEVKKAFEDNQKKYPEKPAMVLLNKMDMEPKERKISSGDLRGSFKGVPIFEISAIKGTGLDVLSRTIESFLPEGPAYYPEDQTTVLDTRTIVGELIREKAMSLTHQELPYSIAVEIVSYKEESEIDRIEANVVVEHQSQKGMVIGSGGKMIREIGIEARKDIEKLLEKKVYLGLHAKVDKNWTKDPAKMARYGYGGKA